VIQWNWPGNVAIDWKSDRGLAYGDGVFETLRVLPRGPVLAERHRERLLAGCKALGLPFTQAHWDRWWQEIDRRRWLHAENSAGHIIKIIVTRGSGGRGYRPPAAPTARVISARSAAPRLPEAPVRLHVCQTPVTATQPGNGLKTLSRLDQVLASREIPRDCFEGLMTDSQGRPVEGTRSNIFVLSNDILYTPPRWQLAVDGVMRQALVECLPQIGLEVRERPLIFAQLRQSQGAFIANSVMGVLAVAGIGCLNLRYAERIADVQAFTRQHFGI
jgi:4-amino-4-deoxychorismate lyase